jgi:hypothetical protein
MGSKMMSFFWTNTIWYIVLLMTSILSLVFIIKRSSNKWFTVTFMAATLGLMFYIEAILVILLDAYSYYPKITPDDPFQDTVFGNLFSQLSISATSSLAIVYSLSYIWYAVFAVVYYLVDVLFVKLRIYEHHWYQSAYTLIGFAPLFICIRYWYKKLISATKKTVHYLTLHLAATSVTAVFFTLPLKVSKVEQFAVHFFEDASKNHTTTNLLYGLVIMPLFILLHKLRMHWVYKVLILGVLLALRYAFYRAGYIFAQPNLFFPVATAEFALRYVLILKFDRILQQKPRAEAVRGL